MILTVLIPALNEEKKIAETVKKVADSIKKYEKTNIIVIDDGSKDNTKAEAEKAGAKVLKHHINRGVGAAFQTGLEWALQNKTDVLVNIDADGQFDPADIDVLLNTMKENQADLVISNRFTNGKPENMTGIKFWGNKLMNNLITSLAGQKFSDVSSGFRAYNRKALLNLNLMGDFTYTHEAILNLANKKLNIVEVPVSVKYFKKRKSRVAGNILKYALKTSLIIFKTYRDYRPLKFFGSIGLLIFFLGIILDSFVLGHYIINKSFSPFIFVILTGVYLNSLGLGIIILGIITDMFDRIRKNQERILYNQKVAMYHD